MLRTALLLIVLLRSVAFAEQDPADLVVPLVAVNGEEKELQAPRFAFGDQDWNISPPRGTSANYDAGSAVKGKTVKAEASDKSAFWVSSDVRADAICGMKECAKNPGVLHHVTALFEPGGKPIAWHVAKAVTSKEQTKAMAKGIKPETFDQGVDNGAEDAVKLFETTIGDGKSLAATVSDRKDVVLYGSDPSERFVGGAKAKVQLTKWNLVLKPTGGIQAGVSKSGTVAWVAANVEAMPKKGSKAKPAPYRALFIYEKANNDWRLVNAHFSFLTTL